MKLGTFVNHLFWTSDSQRVETVKATVISVNEASLRHNGFKMFQSFSGVGAGGQWFFVNPITSVYGIYLISINFKIRRHF